MIPHFQLVAGEKVAVDLPENQIKEITVKRHAANPLITESSSKTLGSNINGPSVIRVPSWIKRPYGKYYMYFAHHQGKFIRLAYSEALGGPWTVYVPGTLSLMQATAFCNHIASPDVHVDEERRQIRMYFHGVTKRGQHTGIATSVDGLNFEASDEILGKFYFRVWQWEKAWYALAKNADSGWGELYRSQNGLTGFESRGNFLRLVRHSAVLIRGHYLLIFYSRKGDAPERIVVATVDMRPDWRSWQPSEAMDLLRPEAYYEGIQYPIKPSEYGAAIKVNQLRDPCIYEEGGKVYLFYTIAGEMGIAMAEIEITMKPAVVINEVLAHSHADASDWIELHNTNSTAIDIGGWFLSDSSSNLTKYQFAAGIIIAPGGYIVFYEDQHFNNPSAPGANQPFALNENGGRLYLSSAEDGLVTGYRQVEDFGGSETGISFGRYFKPSISNYNFVPMSENTPGLANAYPKVGPIVINEIMYNPSWPVGSSNTNDQHEYVELHNISSEPVTLYNFESAQPWKFTDGIDFTFPADVPVTIFANGYLLVVKNPEAFTWRYPSVPAEKILGPYSGSLNNAGERLELSMPGDVDESGELYYIRVDRVDYSDGSHPENSPDGIDLWPTEPDGNDESLTRKVSSDYGNDPDNWTTSTPSPGTINP